MQAETTRLELDLVDRIEWLRRRRGLTPGELVRRSGISDGTLYNWRSRRSRIPAEAVPPLARALGTTTDFLHGLTDDPAPRGPDGEVQLLGFPSDSATPE